MRKKFCLIAFILLSFCELRSQIWLPSGPNDNNQVSYSAVGFTNMTLDANDVPYVIYKDASNGNKATVVQYNAGHWSIVGIPGFTSSAIEYADIAIAPNGTPYIVYQKLNGTDLLDATVMKFSGGVWSVVGTTVVSQQYSFTALSITYPSIAIAIAPDNTPYIAFSDYNDSNLPLAATVKRFNGTGWENVGAQGFTGGDPYSAQALALDFAIAPDGSPYLLFVDNGPNLSITNSATLMMFDGTNWNLVGSEGFSNANIAFPSLCIAADGTPFVAYQDVSHSNKCTVKKFDGLNWENVGPIAFSAGSAANVSLAVTSENLPIVAYKDMANGNRATVKLFDGLNWIDPGTANFSYGAVQFPKIVLTSTDIPLIVYQDASAQMKATVKMLDTDWSYVGSSGISGYPVSYVSGAASKISSNFFAAVKDARSGKATVLKFENTNWSTLSNSEFTPGTADFLSLALSTLDESVHLAFKDGANGGKASVVYLAADGWANLGNPGFSAGAASHLSLDFAPDGTPYVAFTDGSNGDRLTVMKYNGLNWVNVGTPGFSTGATDDICLKVGSDGVPYVIYFDNTNGKATAKKFLTNAWVNVGPSTGFSPGAVSSLSLAVDASNTLYVSYKNEVNGMAVVRTFNGTSWVDVGGSAVSASSVNSTSLVIDDGNPVLAYSDGTVSNRITVKRFQAGTWSTVGSQGFSASAASNITIMTAGNILRVTYADGYAWARSFTDFTPLPVKLISFIATKEDNKVHLKWVTASEINSDYFIIEHSTNGKDYTEIGRRTGLHNSSSMYEYNLFHESPRPGVNYYRLKQVDYDGRIVIYPLRKVMFDRNYTERTILYPNPAKSNITISGVPDDVSFIQVVSSNGQTMLERVMNSPVVQADIDISMLRPGMYVMIIFCKNDKQSIPFIKE